MARSRRRLFSAAVALLASARALAEGGGDHRWRATNSTPGVNLAATQRSASDLQPSTSGRPAIPNLVSDGSADAAAGLQAAINAISQAGGGDLTIPRGLYRIDSQVVVKTSVKLNFDHGAKVVHGAAANLFRMKPRSQFVGGTIDVSGTKPASFSGTVFEFDGTDSSPAFRGVQPTLVRTEIVGRRGAGCGTAFHLHSRAEHAAIYGVVIDSAIDGMEVGVLLEKSGPRLTSWINGNDFKLRGIATVNMIKSITSSDGVDIDGNLVHFDYQAHRSHTRTVIDVKGRYNRVEGMIWDFETGAAVSLSPASSRNLITIGGLLASTLSDLGKDNNVWLFTDVEPTLRMGKRAL